ncbi:hypothetical protein A1O3_10455 [Capronia epimyces CBS 606.96]|uniref:Xylanolytic transcriptional activator regulatory domain-containing protein n=1 Tax=Capronia epimyces CBS 606.96 TaxID=1182542 RepID=W9XA01_9EURO|nr:uncharacterized protein A1O3_10455 [Capronia epimyces CBS 606.96]EXJ77297.1 hypothetical protein A1O3_10455 [Capronia epimyces CBS 606.96]
MLTSTLYLGHRGGEESLRSPSPATLLRRLGELEQMLQHQKELVSKLSTSTTPQLPMTTDDDEDASAGLSLASPEGHPPRRLSTPPRRASVPPPAFVVGGFTPFTHLTPLTHHRSDSSYAGDLSEPSHEPLPRNSRPPTDRDGDEEVPLTIPVGHNTATASLFSNRLVRSLVGDYPEDLFFQIEQSQPLSVSPAASHYAPLPEVLASLNLERSHTNALVAGFFARVHGYHPLLDRPTFMARQYERLQATGPQPDADTALCLVVFALGRLTSTPTPGDAAGRDEESENYFAAAYTLLLLRWPESFGSDTSLVLGLVYAALYLCYMVRPLHASRLIHMASYSLQLMTNQLYISSVPQDSKDHICRLCWVCFVLECDSLAEFHLPRSGIEVLIDKLPFPRFDNQNDPDALASLAACSIRRLLNRIHSTIYSNSNGNGNGNGLPTSTTPYAVAGPTLSSSFASDTASTMDGCGGPTITSLWAICMELMRQLDTWYQSLPDLIRPDLSLTSSPPRDVRSAWLCLRYWSTKHIIYRPFVLFVVNLEGGADTLPLPLPPHILSSCYLCVESCRNYIAIASHVLVQRTPYTWMILHSVLACTFVLAMTSRSPLLKSGVPDISRLLTSIIQATQTWATPDSSAESIIWMLQTIQQKGRFRTSPGPG